MKIHIRELVILNNTMCYAKKRASLIAQLVKNWPAMKEILV